MAQFAPYFGNALASSVGYGLGILAAQVSNVLTTFFKKWGNERVQRFMVLFDFQHWLSLGYAVQTLHRPPSVADECNMDSTILPKTIVTVSSPNIYYQRLE